MDLVLGVVDVAYEKGETTGKVANILENKYHVMEIFSIERHAKIETALTDAVAAAIDHVVMRKNSPISDIFFGATEQIAEQFRDFLDAGEVEKIMPITQPIAAAQMGVNSRKKAGVNAGNQARVAFVDTGLYRQSMRAWIEK